MREEKAKSNSINFFKKKYKRKSDKEEKLGREMGNAIGGSKKAKVMKIDGETIKLKTPAVANDVVKDYPGHVLLDSNAVKHFGLRAKPLEPHHELRPKKIYFLVQLPKVQPEPLPRRVRSSGIRGMNAKDRLDFLMLSKRSVSDLTMVKHGPGRVDGGPTRVKMRLPKAQLDRLVEESHDGGEVAEKILSLYIGNNAAVDGGGIELNNHKPRRKRVSFSPVQQGEICEEAAPQQALVYSTPSR